MKAWANVVLSGWILWQGSVVPPHPGPPPLTDLVEAFDTKHECTVQQQRNLNRFEKGLGKEGVFRIGDELHFLENKKVYWLVRYVCLPDTFNPRGGE